MRNIKVLNSNILKIYYYAMAIACLWVFIEVGKTEKKKKTKQNKQKDKEKKHRKDYFRSAREKSAELWAIIRL
jgi:fucose permease